MEGIRKYSLYVGELQKLPDDIRFSYYNAEHKYLLLYTDKKPSGDFIDADDKMLYDSLNPDEKIWLAACKTTLMVDYMKETAQNTSKSLSDFANILEVELKKEIKNLKKQKKE